MANEKSLNVLISGFHVGAVTQMEGDQLKFEYAEEWREGRIQIPLSLSMPLAERMHRHHRIAAFIWGLLPDNEQTLQRWATRFQVSPRSPFALISAVGQDCAGAVQFLLPEAQENSSADRVTTITEQEIGARLTELRADAAATRRMGDHGQFSLAGAQAKTAFYRDPETGAWGIPEGRIPTTHIFKPPMPHLSGQAENEHYCLKLANLLGIEAANSQVMEFDGQQVIVVERYDRAVRDGKTIRIHQEDMCQALGLMPQKKYENEGGPGIKEIIGDVLSASNDPAGDTRRFMEANIFNFLIAGTDAHAKNYSMILGPRSTTTFAPLYDVSSILPHLGEGETPADMHDLRLAMKVGGYYEIEKIMPRHWERCARAGRFPGEETIAIIRHFIEVLPDMAFKCAVECLQEGLTHPILRRLPDLLAKRAATLRRLYRGESEGL
ncbi:type II toxin-antitoxin system HipA family toxin [Mesorhizobium retamae]|uniref:Type II toxin-antitoxin system HipA family toxin n=1 Tax=Mesorhizobium retamae TaxID=2912854 RepID=A0ABS9QBT3_9HYPH|nr:type II toxin-antitoxin system HipA family toxin [Mesorhizobium sp. IRAMC:0171]MCG7504877.1 type II toxin-antitoxin system HipA family toxin [Mesorhizobium sp. IRAMC:0171]